MLNQSFITYSKKAAKSLALLVIFLAVLGLLGWTLRVERFTNIFAGFPTMKFNTALAFIFAGAALLLGVDASPGRMRRQVWWMRAFAGASALIGLLTLLEYFFAIDLGIDQLWMADWITAPDAFPGRMSLFTALNFFLLGSAFALFHAPWKYAWNASYLLGALPGLIASVALVTYVFDAESLYSVYPYESMSVNTALAFWFLTVGIYLSHPDQGWMAPFVSQELGGQLLRRLYPAMLGLGLFFSLGVLLLQRGAYITLHLGMAILAILAPFAVGMVLVFAAARVNQLEVQKKSLYHDKDNLAAIIESSQDAIISADMNGGITSWNEGAVKLFGFEGMEVIGVKVWDLMNPGIVDAEKAVFERIRQGEAVESYETLGTKKDGTFLHVSLTVSPMFGEDRNIIGVSAILRDITERKRVEENLRESEQRFTALFQKSPIPIALSKMPDGLIVDVNQAFLTLFGFDREDMIGKTTLEIGLVRDDVLRSRLIDEVREKGYLHDFEYQLYKKSGDALIVSMNTEAVELAGEMYVITNLQDITARKQAQDEAQKARNLFDTTFHEGPIASALVSLRDQRVADVNRAFEELTGASRADVVGQYALSLPGWGDPADRQAVFETVMREGGISNHEFIYPSALSGEMRSGLISIQTIDVQGEKYLLSKITDITAQKQAETTLRELARRIQSARESERVRVSHQLHDELGQELTLLKFDLAKTRRKLLPEQTDLLEYNAAMLRDVDILVEKIQQISSELRPNVLDELGLTAAIEWQAHEFIKRTNLQITLALEDVTIRRKDGRLATLYRIFQEALTNVSRHARAEHVNIKLQHEDGNLVLEIIDDGIGFDHAKLGHLSSIGLFGMRERANTWGGEVIFGGGPEKGTTVIVRIPFQPDEEVGS